MVAAEQDRKSAVGTHGGATLGHRYIEGRRGRGGGAGPGTLGLSLNDAYIAEQGAVKI